MNLATELVAIFKAKGHYCHQQLAFQNSLKLGKSLKSNWIILNLREDSWTLILALFRVTSQTRNLNI